MIKVCTTLGEELFPTKGTDKSAGWDLRAPHDIIMPHNSLLTVDTGIIIDAKDDPRSLVYMLVPRSSLGIKHGVILQNTVGIVDQDYAGPTDTIKAALRRLPAEGWTCLGPMDREPSTPYEKKYKGQIFRAIPSYFYNTSPAANVLYEAGERFLQMLIFEYVDDHLVPIQHDQVALVDRGMNSTGEK